MFAMSLLARSSPLRLSAVLTTRSCTRSLSTLRLSHPARSAVPPRAGLRRFSAALALRTERRDDTQTSPAPSGTCFIANIPYKVTAEELKDAFSQFGKVISVRLLTTNAGLPRGLGHVHFETVADAVNFVDSHLADPILLLDRQLFVEHAQKPSTAPSEPSDTLVMLKFQGDSDVGLRAMFGNFAHNILAVRFDKKDEPLRNAFIQFRDVDTAKEAMEIFRSRNESAQIRYARQRQTPERYSLTSRLSQHRGQ